MQNFQWNFSLRFEQLKTVTHHRTILKNIQGSEKFYKENFMIN